MHLSNVKRVVIPVISSLKNESLLFLVEEKDARDKSDVFHGRMRLEWQVVVTQIDARSA